MVRDKRSFSSAPPLWPAYWPINTSKSTVTDSLLLLNNKTQGATWAIAKKLTTQLLNIHFIQSHVDTLQSKMHTRQQETFRETTIHL